MAVQSLNQRFYHVSIQIHLWKGVVINNEAKASFRLIDLQQTCRESTLFHLLACYRAYLIELAKTYQLTNLNIRASHELAEAMQENGMVSHELNEILALEQRPGSWLNRLFSEEKCIFMEASLYGEMIKHDGQKQKKSNDYVQKDVQKTPQEIPQTDLSQISSTKRPLELADAIEIQRAMKEMVERHRLLRLEQ